MIWNMKSAVVLTLILSMIHSCATSNSVSIIGDLGKWRVAKLPADSKSVPESELATAVIDWTKINYPNLPQDPDYLELEPDVVFSSEKKNLIYVVFSVRYVDDSRIVIVSDLNGRIVDNFALSTFAAFEDK